MKDIAVVWIRDGVLVDRMPENAVAFAMASWQYISPDIRSSLFFHDLINWGFKKSGFSAAEKMQLFNRERQGTIKDITGAAAYYTALVTGVENSLEYFEGTVELLKDLKNKGIHQYITSAIDQEVLDNWRKSKQGDMISKYLVEILGKRPGFSKGKSHFSFLQKQGFKKIYFIADAVSEIQTGSACADYGVIPIGFAHVITRKRIREACKRLKKSEKQIKAKPLYPIDIVEIDQEKIILPDASQLVSSLTKAGAVSVIRGTKKNIMQNLRNYFVKEDML